MRSSHLVSREWCDLVFENRNKAYGAYRLRAQAGRRYRLAVGAVVGAALLGAAAYGGMVAYVSWAMRDEKIDAEEALRRLRPTDLKEGYKLKFLATARQVPPKRMAPGATQSAPEIVDGLPEVHALGNDGPIAYDPEQEMITTPIVDTTNIGNEELPVAKEKVVPTEMMNRMPLFPGGPRAFMRWLDEHVTYPAACRERGLQGVVTLSFVVDRNGYATDLEVKDAFDPAVYRVAMEALKRLPKWRPGTDEWGEPTPVKITVPVEFKL